MSKVITDEDLIQDLLEVSKMLGRIPTCGDYRKHGRYNPCTLERRFGGWNKSLIMALGEINKASPSPRISHACACCGKLTKNYKFCSQSCSATVTNSSHPRRRKKSIACERCGQILSRNCYRRCRECYLEARIVDRTGMKRLSDFSSTYARHRYQNIRNHAHAVARIRNIKKECVVCAYRLHVELCHKKDIASFSNDALLNEINHPDNLVFLCRNHHWELDHGYLVLPV